MKKIDIDIAIDSFAAETIDIAIAIENFIADNWYCHWPKNFTIAHVWFWGLMGVLMVISDLGIG